jgi:hypothetical protein
MKCKVWINIPKKLYLQEHDCQKLITYKNHDLFSIDNLENVPICLLIINDIQYK